MSLLIAEGVDYMTFEGPLQPKLFYDTVILLPGHLYSLISKLFYDLCHFSSSSYIQFFLEFFNSNIHAGESLKSKFDTPKNIPKFLF